VAWENNIKMDIKSSRLEDGWWIVSSGGFGISYVEP
jgi:hypothetical protein